MRPRWSEQLVVPTRVQLLILGCPLIGETWAQAIRFFQENATKTGNDIVVEIDRTIVRSGQALADRLGGLKIKELRAAATKELGPKFDMGLFHDELLRHGAVPLSVLDASLRAWMAEQKRGPGGRGAEGAAGRERRKKMLAASSGGVVTTERLLRMKKYIYQVVRSLSLYFIVVHQSRNAPSVDVYHDPAE